MRLNLLMGMMGAHAPAGHRITYRRRVADGGNTVVLLFTMRDGSRSCQATDDLGSVAGNDDRIDTHRAGRCRQPPAFPASGCYVGGSHAVILRHGMNAPDGLYTLVELLAPPRDRVVRRGARPCTQHAQLSNTISSESSQHCRRWRTRAND